METMKQFVNKNKVRLSVEWADENKNNPEWKDANHYKVTLKMGRRQLSTYFSQGYGIKGEPRAEDVLSALASDSAGIENARSFEDWAGDLGYDDTDSRKAEKVYKACERQADKLKNFLGDDLYRTLLWQTENL